MTKMLAIVLMMALISSCTSGGSAANDLSSNPASWPTPITEYSFEGTGAVSDSAAITATVGSDATAHVSSGTLAYSTPGKVGSALTFDGVGSYADLTRPVSDDFSINYWIKSTQVYGSNPSSCVFYSQPGVVNADFSGSANDFGTSLCAGYLTFGVGNANGTETDIHSTTLISDGTWHMVTVTRTMATGAMVLYIDGVSEATGTGSTLSLTSPPKIEIGRIPSYGGTLFTGSLDELQFWSSALTAAEISALYQAQN